MRGRSAASPPAGASRCWSSASSPTMLRGSSSARATCRSPAGASTSRRRPRGRRVARGSLLPAAVPRCRRRSSTGSSSTAMCRCRRTSRVRRTRTTRARYQTVYARAPGAVAAPTAGLHFDEAHARRAARARGVGAAFVTLHVGAGTFQPVTSRGPRAAPHAQRALCDPGRDRASDCGDRSAGGPDPCRGHDDAAGARVRGRGARRDPCRRGGDRPLHHAGPPLSRSSTSCSPTSTCRARRCSCWCRRSRATTSIRAAYAHAIARALPVLQLRRRDAAAPRPVEGVCRTLRRQRVSFGRCNPPRHLPRCASKSSPPTAAHAARAWCSPTASSRRRCSCRSAPTAPSRRWRRTSSRSSARRSCSATPSTSGCGPAPKWSRHTAGCTDSWAGRGRSSPTRAASRCTRWARCARCRRTAWPSRRRSTATACS